MAKKKSARRKSAGRSPSAKAKKAYYKNIEKAYRRLHNVLKEHNPSVIKQVRG